MSKRRTFLRNTTLGALGLSLTSKVSASQRYSVKSSAMCEPTTLDYYGEGPFYTENPPMIEGNILAPQDEPGKRMIISGRILNLDCNEYLPNTIVDVWHANDVGQYDNEGYGLRGWTQSNNQGFYLFETIQPGKYLNGNSFRPSHIHYKITPPSFNTVTTQLYFEGDSSIDSDAAASITEGTYDARNRIIALTENADGVLEGTFDIIINGSGISVGTSDLHLNKGMVYEASPNPFQDSIEIQYGVFKDAKVGLVVFDISGRQVAILEDRNLTADKYTSVWQPQDSLASGHYFIALKINDLQVHYLKVWRP